ncbi:MAG: hypothetical protein AB8B56_05040, partial [Crocinitomicaceae bacterium]
MSFTLIKPLCTLRAFAITTAKNTKTQRNEGSTSKPVEKCMFHSEYNIQFIYDILFSKQDSTLFGWAQKVFKNALCA